MRPGVNTGRALASIGDDVLAYGREQRAADMQMRLAAMRDERERDLAELKSFFSQVRATTGATRAHSGSGAPAFSTRQSASLAGMTDAEFEEAAFVQASGGDQEIKATADSPGMEYADPADRAQLESTGGMRGDTPRTIRGKVNLPAYRAATVAGSVDPNEIDDLATGFETVRLQQDPTVTPEERAKRIASLSGKPMREVRGDTVFDPFNEETGTTDRGEAKGKAELVRAQRPAGSGGRSPAPNNLRDATQAVEVARRAVKDAEAAARDTLLRANPSALSMSADDREGWVARQPRVEAARQALTNAEGYRRQYMQQPGATSLPAGITRDEAFRQARAAIARGANRDAVVQRLRQYGIDAGAL